MTAAGTWFDRAGLGVFVHWTHSSVAGRELSWPLVGGLPALPRCQVSSVDEYYETAAAFDPDPAVADEWCRVAAAAGATYIVLTARHHDGYSLFPSDFGAPRDVVRGFVDAARAHGLRVGLYLSLSDWHHPDYPPFTDDMKPYPAIAYPRPEPDAWARYVDRLFGEVEHLLTAYGPIDLLWFDGGWERTADEWRAAELRAHIRALQPDCLVNERLPGQGDFETPEQFVPAVPPPGPWETCMTMDESWGHNPDDPDRKSARELVHALCEVAGRGGNLLLNVGPTGDGSLPEWQVERLAAVARWMAANGESIVDTGPGLEAWQHYGPSTRRGERVFVHLLARPYDTATVRGVPIRRVATVRHLATGVPLRYTTRCAILDSLLSPDPMGEVVIEVPEDCIDELATVLEVTFTSL